MSNVTSSPSSLTLSRRISSCVSGHYSISGIWLNHAQSTVKLLHKYPTHLISSIKPSTPSLTPPPGSVKATNPSIISSSPNSNSSTVSYPAFVGLGPPSSGQQTQLNALTLMQSKYPPKIPTTASMDPKSAITLIAMRRDVRSTLPLPFTKPEVI